VASQLVNSSGVHENLEIVVITLMVEQFTGVAIGDTMVYIDKIESSLFGEITLYILIFPLLAHQSSLRSN